jgi:hypothetical protein
VPPSADFFVLFYETINFSGVSIFHKQMYFFNGDQWNRSPYFGSRGLEDSSTSTRNLTRVTDLMSLLKNRPKCSPTFLVNHNYGKMAKICGLLQLFSKNLSRVINHPLKFAQSGHPKSNTTQTNVTI